MDKEQYLSINANDERNKTMKMGWMNFLYFRLGIFEIAGLFLAGALTQLPYVLIRISGSAKISVVVFLLASWVTTFSILTLVFIRKEHFKGIPSILIISIGGSFTVELLNFVRFAQPDDGFAFFVQLQMADGIINLFSIFCVIVMVRILRFWYYKIAGKST